MNVFFPKRLPGQRRGVLKPVFAPLPGVIGSMMAVETLKVISRTGDVLYTHMMIYDALYGETRKIAIQKRSDCPVCGKAS